MKKVLTALGMMVLGALAMAAENTAGGDGGVSRGLIGLGIGLAVGLGALGTGVAQARIGAAGVGAVAEKPGMFGTALIFLLLPETLVIFGLVIAFILLGRL
ncbi:MULTISPECIES: F0F1 ATP synthase subunit C [Oceanithermus]|uniref:H+transporting two-sector ATPase C subunit n=3 Tax=Oceanithermus TaxID=208447 RepID=E4U990_OCEP5|nr:MULTISPECIES: F0F1 ATP synthase subunit C [Oceanithermus]ADR36919.1 H+transporting two-sector ATPase C subunit [Oceanithermus profundus DSM 14977]MBB6028815.1 V/A-type H+-transporting ATPase subunit K [Oceanithermus desulfurans]GEM88874.1 F0F1 ATP synthase subunit C [Oceanithermus desulfurans NBRC 100063]